MENQQQTKTDSENVVPGQLVLTGFEEILKVESSRLKKPEQERFCWEYVTNGGRPGPAYKIAVNPNSNDDTARSCGYQLLRKLHISARIAEITTIIQRKYENEVIAARIRTINFNPKVYFNDDGTPKRLIDLSDEHCRGVGLEARYVDGATRYLPVFPLPEKAYEALQKMFGMNRESLALTGKDGGPIKTDSNVTIYIPANGRD